MKQKKNFFCTVMMLMATLLLVFGVEKGYAQSTIGTVTMSVVNPASGTLELFTGGTFGLLGADNTFLPTTGRLVGETKLDAGLVTAQDGNVFFVATPAYGWRVKWFEIDGKVCANRTGNYYAPIDKETGISSGTQVVVAGSNSNIGILNNSAPGFVCGVDRYDTPSMGQRYAVEIIKVALADGGTVDVKVEFEKELALYSEISVSAVNTMNTDGTHNFFPSKYGVVAGPAAWWAGNNSANGGVNDWIKFDFKDGEKTINEIRLYNRNNPNGATEVKVEFFKKGIVVETLDKQAITNYGATVNTITFEPITADAVKITNTQVNAAGAGYQRIQIIEEMDSPSITAATVNFIATENGTLKAYSYTGVSTLFDLNGKIDEFTGKLNTAGMTSLLSGNEVSKEKTVFFVAEPAYGYRVKEFFINGEPWANHVSATHTYIGSTSPTPDNHIVTSNITKLGNYYPGAVYDIVNKKAGYTGEVIAIRVPESGNLTVQAVFEKELAAYSVITGKGVVENMYSNDYVTWPLVPETLDEVRPRLGYTSNGTVYGNGYDGTVYGVIAGPSMILVGRTAETAPDGNPDYIRFDFKDENGFKVQQQIKEIRLFNRRSFVPQILGVKLEFGNGTTVTKELVFGKELFGDGKGGTKPVVLPIQPAVSAEWVKIITVETSITDPELPDIVNLYQYAGYQRVQIIASSEEDTPPTGTITFSTLNPEGGTIEAYTGGTIGGLGAGNTFLPTTGRLIGGTKLSSGSVLEEDDAVFFVATPAYGWRVKQFFVTYGDYNNLAIANRANWTYTAIDPETGFSSNPFITPSIINSNSSNIGILGDSAPGFVYGVNANNAESRTGQIYAAEIIRVPLTNGASANVKVEFERELAVYSKITVSNNAAVKTYDSSNFFPSKYGVVTGPSAWWPGANAINNGVGEWIRFDFEEETTGKAITKLISEIRLYNRNASLPQINEVELVYGTESGEVTVGPYPCGGGGASVILNSFTPIAAKWVKIITTETVQGTSSYSYGGENAGYLRVQIIEKSPSLSDLLAEIERLKADTTALGAANRGLESQLTEANNTINDLLAQLENLEKQLMECFGGSSILPVSSKSLQLYPNPATDHITISGLKGNETLHFCDINGALLFNKEAIRETEKISIAHLPTGVYLVKIDNSVMKVTKK